jgi:hypothetical protein
MRDLVNKVGVFMAGCTVCLHAWMDGWLDSGDCLSTGATLTLLVALTTIL